MRSGRRHPHPHPHPLGLHRLTPGPDPPSDLGLLLSRHAAQRCSQALALALTQAPIPPPLPLLSHPVCFFGGPCPASATPCACRKRGDGGGRWHSEGPAISRQYASIVGQTPGVLASLTPPVHGQRTGGLVLGDDSGPDVRVLQSSPLPGHPAPAPRSEIDLEPIGSVFISHGIGHDERCPLHPWRGGECVDRPQQCRPGHHSTCTGT